MFRREMGSKRGRLDMYDVMVNVTRSLTLVSFGRVSLVEYTAKYEVSISYSSKVMASVKAFRCVGQR